MTVEEIDYYLISKIRRYDGEIKALEKLLEEYPENMIIEYQLAGLKWIRKDTAITYRDLFLND
ncbi:hypothetical protein [Enterococcus phage vB_EfaS_Ef7.1]|nr:hypothetical protein [Enterococcus phage vB_EfaS_Ef7.1]